MKQTSKRSKSSPAVVNQFLVFLMLLYLSSTVAAQGTITLDVNSLPSTQGWIYFSDGSPETSIFSVSEGILTQNTLAGPFTVERYKRQGVLDPSFPFSIAIRARVVADSGICPTNPFGFAFGATAGEEIFLIGLSTSRIQDVRGVDLSTTADNTIFHDYRLEVTPGVGYSLFVDGTLLGSGLPRFFPQPDPDNLGANELVFGDSTRCQGALAGVMSYTFIQQLPVTVDIKPGSFPNSINPRSNGVIAVAILTTAIFDATTVDPMSVRFGPNRAVEAHGRGHIEDVDGDGDLDLVLHFITQEAGIACGATSASLTGNTFSGRAITGTDSINTVGCR